MNKDNNNENPRFDMNAITHLTNLSKMDEASEYFIKIIETLNDPRLFYTGIATCIDKWSELYGYNLDKVISNIVGSALLSRAMTEEEEKENNE